MTTRERLLALLRRGCYLPAARDHATLMLRLADERAAREERAGTCETGCTEPPIEPEPDSPILCGRCAARMMP